MKIGSLNIEWGKKKIELPRRVKVPNRERGLRVALSKLDFFEARAVADLIEERIAQVELQYRQPEMAASHGDLASCAGASGWMSLCLDDFWEAWRGARKGSMGEGEKGENGGNGELEDYGEVSRTRGYGS